MSECAGCGEVHSIEPKCPIWDQLMAGAYAKWGDAETYKYFLRKLTPTELRAVLLGNLNYQVENGGFAQWVCNGYGCVAERVIEFLKECWGWTRGEARLEAKRTGREYSPAWMAVEAVGGMVTIIELFLEVGAEKSDDKQLNDKLDEADVDHICAQLDTSFYALGDQFKREVEKWLKHLVEEDQKEATNG